MYGKIQKLRFAAMAVSIVFAALTFFAGALWIKSLYDGVDRARLEDSGREIRSKVTVLRQVVQADMVAFEMPKYLEIFAKPTSAQLSSVKLVPDHFDIVFFYTADHKYIQGLHREGKDRSVLPFSKETGAGLVPADSAIFDVAASEGQASGILVMEGKPFVAALKAIRDEKENTGFVLAGRKLDTRKLAPTATMSESAFDVFVPNPKVGFPADVEQARLRMVSDNNFESRLEKRGYGTGYLRFNDIFERTAFVLRFPWVDSTASGEKRALSWLFLCSMVFGGLIHLTSSAALTWFVRQRRHNPGLSGLSEKEFTLTIESFPGYAFALNRHGEYVGLSRSLSGLLGKEPSEFYGKKFGGLVSECGFDAAKVYQDLAESNDWPATCDVKFGFKGLEGEDHLEGTAHILSQRHVAMYLLRPSRGGNLDCANFDEFYQIQRSGAVEVMSGLSQEVSEGLADVQAATEELKSVIEAQSKVSMGSSKAAVASLQLVNRVTNGVSRVRSVVVTAMDRAINQDVETDQRTSENVERLVHSAVNELSRYTKGPGVKLEVVCIDKGIAMVCKRRPFIHAVSHLIVNGVDAVAGTAGAWAKVEIRCHGQMVEVSVTDSGSGIEQKVEKMLFRPFFSTKASASRQHMGLGLSIAQGFALSHSGSLEYDATAKNTRFVLTLPLNPVTLQQVIENKSEAKDAA